MQASWGWTGDHPQYPGHSSSSLKWAARRVQAGRVGHRGVFLRAEGTETPGPGASCCQEGKGLGFQRLRLFRRRKSIFVHGLSKI